MSVQRLLSKKIYLELPLKQIHQAKMRLSPQKKTSQKERIDPPNLGPIWGKITYVPTLLRKEKKRKLEKLKDQGQVWWLTKPTMYPRENSPLTGVLPPKCVFNVVMFVKRVCQQYAHLVPPKSDLIPPWAEITCSVASIMRRPVAVTDVQKANVVSLPIQYCLPKRRKRMGNACS